MSIPLLAIPVINAPEHLAACIASIDAEIGRLLIIDNSPNGSMGAVAEAHIPASVHELFVTRPPSNLGFAASINFAIRTAPRLAWWAIANADVVFGRGDIDRLAEAMAGDGPRCLGIIDWRLFGMNAECIDTVGFWDENFHPAYVEDCDWEYRCRLAGIDRRFLPGTTSHIGSVAIRSDSRYAIANSTRSFPANHVYFERKWGGPIRGGEVFTTPFDKGGSVADWTLERRRLADQQWEP